MYGAVSAQALKARFMHVKDEMETALYTWRHIPARWEPKRNGRQ